MPAFEDKYTIDDPNAKSGKCHFCGKECDEENFCYGCKKHICEGCDLGMVMGMNHSVEAHREYPDEEEDEEGW